MKIYLREFDDDETRIWISNNKSGKYYRYPKNIEETKLHVENIFKPATINMSKFNRKPVIIADPNCPEEPIVFKNVDKCAEFLGTTSNNVIQGIKQGYKLKKKYFVEYEEDLNNEQFETKIDPQVVLYKNSTPVCVYPNTKHCTTVVDLDYNKVSNALNTKRVYTFDKVYSIRFFSDTKGKPLSNIK